ncbi:major facilitator superfamily domain-containing protein [Syncephalastrum racemosum]|uniref:Major facilitator superfamily domain-containing protein n=1 Tax=Syncephalastrum racemosum TaxID=13706 RepID=A0A1X2HE14_SYNRA|nr:major facilitator superfamily domain-containing protein [Syncephalastrum racemosum]
MEDTLEEKERSTGHQGLSRCRPATKDRNYPDDHHGNVHGFARTASDMEQNDDLRTIDIPHSEDSESTAPWDQPIPTEGWRNPGWCVILSPFLVGFATTGNSFCWGLFQELYATHTFTNEASEFTISWIGSIQFCALVIPGLIITPVIRRLGFRRTIVIGAFFNCFGYVLASLATHVWQLFLTQGIMIGLGGGMAYATAIPLPSQWFNKRRALAVGLGSAGTGIGGLCLSPLTEYLISHFGFRIALRVLGCFSLGLLLTGGFFARSRYRPPPSAPTLPGSLGVFWDPDMQTVAFVLLMIFSLLAPIGFFSFIALAPSYAAYLDGSKEAGSLVVSLISGTNAICRILSGFVADRIGRVTTLAATTFLSGLFAMTLWQFSSSINTYIAYSVICGLTSGVYNSLIPIATAEVAGMKNIQRGTGVCLFLTIFTNSSAPSIAKKLQSVFGWTAAIQFLGAGAVAAGLVAFAVRLTMPKKSLHPP